MLKDLESIYNSEAEEQQQKKVLNQLIIMINEIYTEVTAIYSIELQVNKFGNLYAKYQKTDKFIRHTRMEKVLKRLVSFLYLLRTWLTGEEIILRLGGTDVEGSGLAKVDVRQDKWLADLSINISRKAIELSHEVSSLLEEEAKEDAVSGLSQLWSIVKEAADFSNVYDKESDAKINQVDFYQKENARDTEVYIRFAGKYSRPIAYYAKQFYYNMGWIYEWLMDFIENTDIDNSDLKEYFNTTEHPLAILFYTHAPDSVRSLQGGDVKNFQVKYGNKKLLSFHQLLLYIQQMHDIINQYNDKREGSAKQVIEELKELFIQKNQKQVNLSARQKVLEELVAPLENVAKS